MSQRLGRRLGEVFPDLASYLAPYLHRALDGEPVCDLELRRPRPNEPGKFSTLLFSCHPARDEAGDMMGLSIAVVDITGHRRIEAALQDLRERYRQMFESKPCMLWAIGSGGILVEAHPDREPVMVMCPEQIRNNEWLAALHVEDLSPAVAAILHSLQTGEPIDIKHRMRRLWSLALVPFTRQSSTKPCRGGRRMVRHKPRYRRLRKALTGFAAMPGEAEHASIAMNGRLQLRNPNMGSVKRPWLTSDRSQLVLALVFPT
jgi:hypothetical protein